MHKEFLAEYVRKMMKKKIKISDKVQQQKAASELCLNSERIHTCLTAAVSAHTKTHILKIKFVIIFIIIIITLLEYQCNT